ncbi:NAD(P)-dependent alcohol dehydrogenase [Actinoplanes sp. NPDC051470]|uniref:NAD(P)-dependent alcohol dehydrogenase n=1 Tax=Actinoplanes sp. NPDC051470 TaxID=3157224 RepID=UPI00341E5277
MMKAITQHRYGSYEALTCEEIPKPEPRAGEVLLRVAAAGVDPGQWHLMAGLPLAARLAFGPRAPRDKVRGRDVAGTVVGVGPGVTGLAEGDEVFGVADGSFAEYAVASAKLVVPRPASVSAEVAAATPTSGYTALRAIAKTSVGAGQRALVIGAGGGIGTMLTQILAARGVSVTGVCSASKLELVSSLGADSVIDYRVDPLGSGYDVVFDIAGLRSLHDLRKLLTPAGTLVLIGGEDNGRWLGGATTRSMRANLMNIVTGHRLRPVLALADRADLEQLGALLAAGTLTPQVERTFVLPATAEALRLLMEGKARGKFVITP